MGICADVFFPKIEESFLESGKQVRNRSETGQKQTIETILRPWCFHRDCCLIFRFILHRNSGSKTRNSFTIIVTRVVVFVVILLLVLALALPVVVTAAIAIAKAVAVAVIIIIVVVVLGRALCKLCRTMPYWDVFCASFVVQSSTGTFFCASLWLHIIHTLGQLNQNAAATQP